MSVQETGDIDLGILDQEAFARVLASTQQPQQQQQIDEPTIDTQPKDVEDEEEAVDVVDDVTYHPSGVGLSDDADPVFCLRMRCLPILDILVCAPIRILRLTTIERGNT